MNFYTDDVDWWCRLEVWRAKIRSRNTQHLDIGGRCKFYPAWPNCFIGIWN